MTSRSRKPAPARPPAAAGNHAGGRPALPEAWITPIRLAVYLVILGCSAYIYFNARELEWTHWLVILPIAAVAAMVLLDCRMSESYWKKHAQQDQN